MVKLKEFIINKNEFLNREVRGFYRCDYIKFRHPENPDYLVHLKNTSRNKSGEKLKPYINELLNNLEEEIKFLVNEFNSSEPIMVCVVPRSKSYDFYKNSELLFSRTINYILNKLIEKNININNGIDCITRHTNTKTTHLNKSEYGNYGGDGEMPYPGITNDTCHISDKIIGRKILLIDDIYTKTVNVDEDVIQALFDKGAKEVIFFAIAKTKSKLEDVLLSIEDIDLSI